MESRCKGACVMLACEERWAGRPPSFCAEQAYPCQTTRLPSVTSYGCYTLRYVLWTCDDGGRAETVELCAACASLVRDRAQVEDRRFELFRHYDGRTLREKDCWLFQEAYDEGPPVCCDECGALTMSSYGDPDAESDATS